MVWLLIRNTDSNSVPTLATWKNTMQTRLIPEAQAFFLANPYTETQYRAVLRYNEYAICKDVLGKGLQSGDKRLEYEKIVSDYEAKPETPENINVSIQLNRRDLNPNKNSKYDYYRYYNHILNVEAVKSDSVKQAELDAKVAKATKAGDIIDIFPDDKVLNIPPPQKFWSLIKVDGLKLEDAQKYTEPDIDRTDPEVPILIRKRKYNLRLISIPVVLRDRLNKDRFAETTFTAIRSFIENKATGLTE